MPILNRIPINTKNNDDHHETLVERLPKADKNYATLRSYNSMWIGSTVAAQWEDMASWTHGTIMDNGNQNHNYQP